VVTSVTCKPSIARGVEPIEIRDEPLGNGVEVGLGQGLGVLKEGNSLRDLGKRNSFDDAIRPTLFGRWDNLGVFEVGGECRICRDEPCSQVRNGLLGVALVLRDDICSSECRDDVAERLNSVAVGSEGIG